MYGGVNYMLFAIGALFELLFWCFGVWGFRCLPMFKLWFYPLDGEDLGPIVNAMER